jgi:hypothetical protein
MFCLAECKEISLTELEKISYCNGGLQGIPLPGGQNKKMADMAALPGGGGMPLHQQIN